MCIRVNLSTRKELVRPIAIGDMAAKIVIVVTGIARDPAGFTRFDVSDLGLLWGAEERVCQPFEVHVPSFFPCVCHDVYAC